MSNWPDFVNGAFELLGAPFICMSIWETHKNRGVHGVSWLYMVFFTLWGYWNLFYYPHLGQVWSFYGGCAIVAANTTWCLQAFYYARKK